MAFINKDATAAHTTCIQVQPDGGDTGPGCWCAPINARLSLLWLRIFLIEFQFLIITETTDSPGRYGGPTLVRDLYAQKDVGNFSKLFNVTVPAMDAHIFKLTTFPTPQAPAPR